MWQGWKYEEPSKNPVLWVSKESGIHHDAIEIVLLIISLYLNPINSVDFNQLKIITSDIVLFDYAFTH